VTSKIVENWSRGTIVKVPKLDSTVRVPKLYTTMRAPKLDASEACMGTMAFSFGFLVLDCTRKK